MKRWTLLFWLVLAVPATAQDIENPEYLRRAAWGLAKQNRAKSLYLFLENQFPTFTGLAEAAGLPEALDGGLSLPSFRKSFHQKLKSYKPSSDQPSAKAMKALFDALHGVLTVFPLQPPAPGESVRALVQNRGPPEALLEKFYNVSETYLAGWDKLKTISVKSVPGELVWFNPDLAIPELGIKPGVPLTDAQKALVLKFFSVRVTNDAAAKIGEASYPSDVGRAVNPRSGVLTIVDGNDGKLLPDLTLKGTGSNSDPASTSEWSGKLDVGEAIFDSEVSLSLMREGVRIYTPVAVIADPANPAKGVSVRASMTFLRHSHILTNGWGSVTPEDAKFLIEKIRQNATLAEGQEFDLREWAKDVLPRLAGRNAGLMSGLGVRHGSATDSNIGVGEQVDFGEPSLGNKPSESQKDWHWKALENITNAANLSLPEGQKIDLAASKVLFEAEFSSSVARVIDEGLRLRVGAENLSLMDESHRKRLYEGYLESLRDLSEAQLRQEVVRLGLEKVAVAKTLTADQARTKIRDAFRNADVSKLEPLLRLLGVAEFRARELALRGEPLAKLRTMARDRGIRSPEGLNRSQLAREIALWGGAVSRPRSNEPELTRRLQGALNSAMRAADGMDPARRGTRVEATLRRLMAAEPGLYFNVKIAELNGKRFVYEIGGRRALLPGGRVIAEADVLRLKPGLALELGAEFDSAKVDLAWEIKSSRRPMRPSQGELYRSVFGRAPIEMHPTEVAARPRGRSSARAAIGQGAVGLGIFAAGFLVKEAVQGLASGDTQRIRNAFRHLKSPWFAGGFAVFSGVEWAASKALGGAKGAWGAVGRFALPIYAGVSILHLVQGKRDLKSIATEATSFAVSALAMQPVMHAIRGALYPALAAAPPWGWVGIGAIEIANAAVMLFGAEKISPYVDQALTATWNGAKAGTAWVKKGATAVGHRVMASVSRLKFW